ncbi:glyoxal oxidase N-terminus-domain-containing protein, partial [Rhizoctonia solani]
AAMQLTVATSTNVVVIDKFEQNPLHDERDKPVWGAVYSTISNTARPLHIVTNSFCATGTWLSNGTLVNIGGNPRVDSANATSPNGLQGRFEVPRVRLFNPCADTGTCDVYESPQRIRLTSSRWYPSSTRLPDGSTIIYGDAYGGSWTNFEALNNPTYEFYPPKNIHGFNGLQIPSQFLKDSLPHNMFPHVILLPDSSLFIAANNMVMKFSWGTNTEMRLPNLPNGQRYSMPNQIYWSLPTVLLPLTWEDNYKPQVAIFGGSQLPSQSPTSKQVSRIALDAAGVAAGWSVEDMPEGRIMADATILPDGKILIINGAKTGTAGYGNVPDQASLFAHDLVGQSNADNPAFTPVLYDPAAPAGGRFSSAGMPTSNIARLYHSVSTLLPDGRVMIAGSNPNADVSTVKYKTEYQVEYLNPPYMTKVRPSYTGLPQTWNYGQEINLRVTLPMSMTTPTITASLMDLGFSTHGVHMDMRMVRLKCVLSLNRRTLTITGPPNASVYPPGPAWLYILANGVPSHARKVLIGNGNSPPVDQGAIDK